MILRYVKPPNIGLGDNKAFLLPYVKFVRDKKSWKIVSDLLVMDIDIFYVWNLNYFVKKVSSHHYATDGGQDTFGWQKNLYFISHLKSSTRRFSNSLNYSSPFTKTQGEIL